MDENQKQEILETACKLFESMSQTAIPGASFVILLADVEKPAPDGSVGVHVMSNMADAEGPMKLMQSVVTDKVNRSEG